MKIQLDTTQKTIKVEESVNLGELTETLERILPNGEWKQFKIETNTVINNFSSPIVIREYPYRPYHWPWYSGYPTITFGGTTAQGSYSNGSEYSNFTPQTNAGVYNLELN